MDPELLTFAGDEHLPSLYSVTDFACSSIGVAALAITELVATGTSAVMPCISVNRRLASIWFGFSIRPDWQASGLWDPIAGDYRTTDGWIRLHTNAPHHRRAVESVLGTHGQRAAIARAVRSWKAGELESAIVAAKSCAAEMRTLQDWAVHEQGSAVSKEPLAHRELVTGERSHWRPIPERPLAGLRVLDLTRVLAGPVATRFLAGYGADVLRIDAPTWDEPGVVPEVTLGKRCARLDLHAREDRTIFEGLLRDADILVHGYRPGALDGLGYGAEMRQAIRPGLIDVSLCAYGWTGPWAARRGFDSLVQMSCGIAEAGMAWKHSEAPIPLPVQALDHATGYLMAAACVRALTERLLTGSGSIARFSLARTAKLLTDLGESPACTPFDKPSDPDYAPGTEETPWGKAQRARVPVKIQGIEMRWERPAQALGSSEATW